MVFISTKLPKAAISGNYFDKPGNRFDVIRCEAGKWGKWPRQESNLDLELRKLLYYPLYDEAYLINPGTLLLKILMAMASNITPKNLRMATIPPGPKIRSIKSRDFNTINTITRLTTMAISRKLS